MAIITTELIAFAMMISFFNSISTLFAQETWHWFKKRREILQEKLKQQIQARNNQEEMD